MTYFPKTQIVPQDGPSVDAFHRLRVSDNVRQFSAMSEYLDNPLIWENATSGTGTVAYQANQCAVRLSTGGTASGASAIRQTRRYMRYMPGKSLVISQTFVMSAAQSSAVAEIGYYDGDNNGVFLQRSGTTVNFILRSFTSGSAVDTTIAQASWNLDEMDGTGPSGVTLDLTKTQILVIDLQFLGVGRVRVGFDLGDKGIVYVHQFLNANINTAAYMSTACLPIRGRVYNTGTAGGTVTLDMICSSVSNEGGVGPGQDSEGIIQLSASNGATLRATSTTFIPIFSIRAATKIGGTAAGTTTNRGQIIPCSSSMYTTADSYYEIWLNATLTGPSWVAMGSNSLCEYDVSATVLTTGSAYKIDSGYLSALNKSEPITLENFINFPLVYTGLNSNQDILTISIRTISGGGTAGATVDWIERY